MEAFDLAAHLHAELGVEIGERLVHQEDRRVAHQRAAERDTLLLAAGEFARAAFEEVRDVQDLCSVTHLLVDHVPGLFAHLQREGEIVEDGLVGVERIVLEHHGDVPVLRVEIGHHPVADKNVAARYRQKPRHEIERRRLAAA